MIKQLSVLAITTLFFVAMFVVNMPQTYAQDADSNKTEVVMVYASWSVVSRELRPIAKQIAEAHKFPYLELDIDNDKTSSVLEKLGVQVPSQTPYVVVIKNGKIIFTQAYPNATTKRLQDDLTDLLSKYL
ncbi:MAG: thioredoxin family protein [Vampirovibrionia bacterium]